MESDQKTSKSKEKSETGSLSHTRTRVLNRRNLKRERYRTGREKQREIYRPNRITRFHNSRFERTPSSHRAGGHVAARRHRNRKTSTIIANAITVATRINAAHSRTGFAGDRCVIAQRQR